ncbi:MAG: phosphotransferase family protein, partial [Gammaproteobacteria bacterium]
MTLIDPTIPVREGEALDEARLFDHLKALHPELQPPMQVSQFPGGASNLT